MFKISNPQFKKIVSNSIDAVPAHYQNHLQNVAFIVEDEPSESQRQELSLRPYETLFGLYEGVPLPARGGNTKLLPDKITLFKLPIEGSSHNLNQLKDIVKNTIWHEVAHYFGLDHLRVDEIEKRPKK